MWVVAHSSEVRVDLLTPKHLHIRTDSIHEEIVNILGFDNLLLYEILRLVIKRLRQSNSRPDSFFDGSWHFHSPVILWPIGDIESSVLYGVILDVTCNVLGS